MSNNQEKESWIADQLTKSSFFHQKLHDWGLLEIAQELEEIKGEDLEWDKEKLNISESAWNKIIHRGIKPIMVFVHPDVLKSNPKRVGYYRMLSMVSQKSMSKVRLSVVSFEVGRSHGKNNLLLTNMPRHLNKIISALIEFDDVINDREFDLWRGMAAGSQAQGSWQNAKGNRAEILIKDIVYKRIKEKRLILSEKIQGKNKFINLKDKRVFILGSEPDIGIYLQDLIQMAVEIKGGIDTAGVLERFGAALKSLQRAKQDNPDSKTIIVIQGVSLTLRAKEELEKSKVIIDFVFTIEEVITDIKSRKKLFDLLSI